MPNDGKHLKQWQWKPGQSGNVKGRPPKFDCSKFIQKCLKQKKDGKQIGELLMNELVKHAAKGNMQAMNIVIDRMEGKAVETVDVSVSNPIESMTDEQVRARISELSGRTGQTDSEE